MKGLLLAIVFGLTVASCGNNANKRGTDQGGGYNQGTQQNDTSTIKQAPTTPSDTTRNR